MKTNQVVKFAFFGSKNLVYPPNYDLKGSLSPKNLFWQQIAITLADYLIKYFKKIDNVSFLFTNESGHIFFNGTKMGLLELINRSAVDIVPYLNIMSKLNIQNVNFAYPFKLYHYTFMTQKTEYKPPVFGIFQTLSSYVWIAIIILVSIALLLIYYAILKWKYSLDKILFHVFAVLLGQSLF